MSGNDPRQERMVTYISSESWVLKGGPWRPIRENVTPALEEIWREFEAIYSHTGESSVAPEQLLRAFQLQVLYSIRIERPLVEQLDYNLLLQWILGLSMDATVPDHSMFTKNRERLIGSQIARKLSGKILRQAPAAWLWSDEHFRVDGTLLDAWALMKSLRPKESRGPRGVEKGYDTHDFVEGLRWANVSPHVAQNDTNRRSAIDRRTVLHPGYAQSQRVSKRIKNAFS